MAVITIPLSFTLYIACRDFRFRFILTLCILLIITDISTAFFAVGLSLESSPIHKEYPIRIAIEVGITAFIFNAGSNSIHWIFAFKYFIISKEIPNAIKAKNAIEI